MRLCSQQKVYMDPGTKEYSRSGPTYHRPQKPSGGLHASHPWNSGLCWIIGLCPQRDHAFPGHIVQVPSNQSTAAARVLWTPCVQKPAGDWGHYVELAYIVILQCLSAFCRDQTEELNEHIIGSTLVSLMSLVVVLISDILTRLQYLF